MRKGNLDTECKLCGHKFSHKYNLKRHLEENLCKKASQFNLYEIYLKFSLYKNEYKNQETQTEVKKFKQIYTQTDINKTNSVEIQTNKKVESKISNIQTQTKITKCKTISTQTKIEDININNELYPIEKIKYDYIKFEDINCFIEKYKFCNRYIYLSKILELLLCNREYTQNQVVKYTKLHPPNFVFLYNKLQNFDKQLHEEIPVEEESKYLNIGNIDLVSEYFYKFLAKVIIKIKDDIVQQSKKDGTWNEWNDYNKDSFKMFEKDIKNEEIIKDSIKYFLKNIIINNRFFRYKV